MSGNSLVRGEIDLSNEICIAGIAYTPSYDIFR